MPLNVNSTYHLPLDSPTVPRTEPALLAAWVEVLSLLLMVWPESLSDGFQNGWSAIGAPC
ncbi:MAG: hypothetical protein AB7O45_00495 [Alphaproteobacteria bacterium]